jgi:hypothetical protein
MNAEDIRADRHEARPVLVRELDAREPLSDGHRSVRAGGRLKLRREEGLLARLAGVATPHPLIEAAGNGEVPIDVFAKPQFTKRFFNRRVSILPPPFWRCLPDALFG